MTTPRIPNITPDTWAHDTDPPIEGVRLRVGPHSVFIADEHLADVAGELARRAALHRRDQDSDALTPAQWRRLARRRGNTIRALEHLLAEHITPAPANNEGTTR